MNGNKMNGNPEEWEYGTIVKFPKEGDMCDHSRGITLLIIARKMLCLFLMKRLQKNIDTKLIKEQADFRHRRFCNERIFTLHNIIEQSLEYHKPLIINYVYFKRVFDSIYRSTV